MGYPSNNFSNSGYNPSPSGWKKSPGSGKKSKSASAGGSDDYQRFLEYLDRSGQSQIIQNKIVQAKLYKQKEAR